MRSDELKNLLTFKLDDNRKAINKKYNPQNNQKRF